MELDFCRSRWSMDQDGVWVSLLVDKNHRPQARRFVDEMPQKVHTAVLKEKREKRSLDANAYCWVLMDRLAQATKIPKEEIYRSAVREIGGNSEVVCIPNQGVDTLCRCWSRGKLGWITDTCPSKITGCTNVVLYYGSSEYDTRQMSRLIELVVQECKQQGIETKTPQQLALLMEEWDASKDKGAGNSTKGERSGI